MRYRKLGKTGITVSEIGLGGFHMGIHRDHRESVRIVHAAVEGGISFLDNSWDYNDGQSEIRMGQAICEGGYRDRVFLMTKIDGQNKRAAAKQLDQSLRRFQLDCIDLVQLHEIIRPEDPRRIVEGGAIEALVEAREAGKIRFIGFTGHKDPDIFLEMLRVDFEFDTVQMPLNCLDAHFRSFEQKVLPVLVERNIGVLGMKPLAAGKALEGGLLAEDCLRYALTLPTSVVITGCESVEQVQQALRASEQGRLSESEREALLRRAAALAKDGGLEEYKTTHQHDGTIMHPEWLSAA